MFNVFLPLFQKEARINKDPTKGPDAENVLKKEREFVSITVHELKAPLGITKWSLEMLQSQKTGSLNQDQLGLINQVYRGNERLLVLVRDLLNLSKLQEGKFEIDPKSVVLESIVSDVIKGFKVQANQKKIDLNWLKPGKPLPKVIADPNRVAQVLTNLVSNAIKYTPDSGKVVVSLVKKFGDELKKLEKKSNTININFFDNPNGYLVLSVEDTGIGISPEDQEKLFTRFFRSKKVLQTQTEGTGLGLYITKSIVNLHQGDIWFTSEVGKGSTFYFSLPIA
jgi:signal transduction histidine kinase